MPETWTWMLAPLFGWLDQTLIQSLHGMGFRTDSSRSNLRNQNICSCPTILTSKAIPILYVESSEDRFQFHQPVLLTSSIHTAVLCPRSECTHARFFPKSNAGYTVILHIHTNTIYYMNMHTMLSAPTRGISSKTPFISSLLRPRDEKWRQNELHRASPLWNWKLIA